LRSATTIRDTLLNGQVLVTGGYDGYSIYNVLATAELYGDGDTAEKGVMIFNGGNPQSIG
jgi:hypothetical protein